LIIEKTVLTLSHEDKENLQYKSLT